MIFPYVVFMFFCGIIPIGYGILEVRNPSWVNMDGGYETFLKVLQDFRVGPAILNVLFLLALFVPLMILTVLSVSLLLDSIEFKYNNAMRLLFLIPGLIPTGVAVLFWSAVVGPDTVWDHSNIRWFIGAISFSTGIGSWIVIQYGSLRSISHEVLEAGIVDGCNRFQLAWRLKLPMISRYVAYMVILLIVNTLQIFNEPNLLMYTNMTTDWSLSQIAFTYAFKNADFAGSSALSIMLLIPNVILALLFVFYTDFLKKSRESWR
jgi:multiple sugar transport system permease protein